MDGFWLRVALSVVVAGASVAAFTAVAERQGSRVGGLLLTLPVKVAIALVLIGLSEDAVFAGEAARAVPAGIAANVVFIAAAALLLRRLRLAVALAVALAVWAAASVAILLAPAPGALRGLAYWALVAGLATVLLHRVDALRGGTGGPADAARARARVLVARALAAGVLVGAALALGHFFGSTVAGLVSVFPSSWITAMVVLARGSGVDMAGATVRVMVVGSAAPALFGVACALTFATLGLLAGTLLALALSTAATLLGGWLLGRVDARALERAGRGLGAEPDE